MVSKLLASFRRALDMGVVIRLRQRQNRRRKFNADSIHSGVSRIRQRLLRKVAGHTR
jgi:hypothetical protein